MKSSLLIFIAGSVVVVLAAYGRSQERDADEPALKLLERRVSALAEENQRLRKQLERLERWVGALQEKVKQPTQDPKPDAEQGAVVSGTVAIDGKPVKGAKILFAPAGQEKSAGVAVTDEEGRYTLKLSSRGEHRVTIVYTDERDDSDSTEKGAEQKSKNDELAALRQKRLEVLKELVAALNQRYATGRATIDQVLRASNQLLEAQLELADDHQDRVAVLDKLVENLKGIEAVVSSRHRQGFVAVEEVLEATAARLKAEIRLERERLRN